MGECKNARMRECENARMRECKNGRMRECKNLWDCSFTHSRISTFSHFYIPTLLPKKITGGESELPVPVIKGGQVNG